jgi:hypothetical protein
MAFLLLLFEVHAYIPRHVFARKPLIESMIRVEHM